RHRDEKPRHRCNRTSCRRRGAALFGRIRKRLLPLDKRKKFERNGGVALLQTRRVLRQPVLHADPSDLHPGVGRLPVQAHADERKPPKRWPRLGPAEARRHATTPGYPEIRTRLL